MSRPRHGSAPGVVQPILTAMLALLPLVISRSTLDSSEFPKTLVLTAGALLIGAWGLAGLMARILATGFFAWIRLVLGRLPAVLRDDPLSLAVLLFLASAIASTLGSINPSISLHGVTDSYSGLVVALATAAVYFASRSLPGTPLTFTRTAWAVSVASFIAAGYAIAQLAGLDPIVWGRRASYGGTFRVFGTLGHPNHLAAYLVMTLPLVAFLGQRTRSLWLRIGLVVLAAGSITVIIATLSRGAWVGLAVTAGVWLVLSLAGRARDRSRDVDSARVGRVSWRVAVAPVALLLAAALLLFVRPALRSDFAARVREIGDLSAPTTRSRIEIWRAGLRMLADRPALGVGVDAFSSAFPRYRTTRYMLLEWGGAPSKAHNELIHVLATQGLVGGAAALLVVLLAARVAWRTVRAGRGESRSAAIAATASLAGFATQDLASFTVVATGSLAAALAGWLAAAAAPRPPAPRSAGPPPSGARPAAAGLALGILIAAILAYPLIWSRWRAEEASFRAIREPEGSPERIDALERAVRIAPFDAHFRSQLGRSYLNRALVEADPARRWELLERARESLSLVVRRVAPDHAYDLACLGRALTAEWGLRPDATTIGEAEAAFAGAASHDSTNADVLLIAAEGYIDTGQGAESRAILLRCATMYPRLAMPLAYLGFQALGEGRMQDAADTLTLALAGDWRGDRMAEATSWNNLSTAYFETGRYEQALAAAKHALDLEPAYRSAATNSQRAAAALERRPDDQVPGGR